MGKGFLIYEEMRKYFPIYEKAVSHIWLCNCMLHSEFPYMGNYIFFLSVYNMYPFQLCKTVMFNHVFGGDLLFNLVKFALKI